MSSEFASVVVDFCPNEHRLDDFFYQANHLKAGSMELWKVVKMLLILSHGNGAVRCLITMMTI